MGIAIECIVLDTPVRFELMIVPMCMFAITLIQFAYAAILHYGLGNLPAAIDANLYADVQLTVSVCLLDFGLTVYALESENVPWHADHIRTIAVAFRVWTFHLLLQMGPEIQDFWVVLPSGILSASNFAFYCTVYLFRRHAIDFWPPRALIKSELAYYDFPVTRLIVIATVFTYYLSRLSCLSAFLYIQPYLYFAYSDQNTPYLVRGIEFFVVGFLLPPPHHHVTLLSFFPPKSKSRQEWGGIRGIRGIFSHAREQKRERTKNRNNKKTI
eukprot:GEMP01079015.1.p1 GENE.GEMP01079015.1~~GEMP01079015.1.p1  ORF type:complete len:270 (+),score=36.86 GEMP01079015.1:197-1006(+)